MHTEICYDNRLANCYIAKLRAQLYVINGIFQDDAEFPWKLLNYYIIDLIEYGLPF